MAEVQALANAAKAVLGYDDPASDVAPTAAQINALVAGQTTGGATLGAAPVSDDALKAVQAAIDAANSDGTPIANQAELADVVKAALDAYELAIDKIADYAETGAVAPATTDYAAAGVTGVSSANLAAINDAINSQNGADNTLGTVDDRGDADSAAEVQAIVNAYNKIITAADGNDSNVPTQPTAADYAAIGVTGVTEASAALLSDVVNGKS